MDNKTDIHTLLTRNSSMFRGHYPKNYVTDAESFISRVTRLPLLAAHIVRAYNSCPYHNSAHAAHVADCCLALAKHESVTNDNGRLELLFASLMHDAGHSGGELPDSENVKRAIAQARIIHGVFDLGLNIDIATRLIAVTEFDAEKQTFVHKPETKLEMIIRDADLLGFTSPAWPEMAAGLFDEVYGTATEGDALSINEKRLLTNLEFLRSCTFYTSFGRTLFAEYASEMSRALVNAGGASNAI